MDKVPGAEWRIKKKKCSKCGCVKPIEDFYKRPDRKTGVQSACKECKVKMSLDYYRRSGKHKPIEDECNEKVCSGCKELKPVSEFYKDPRSKVGRHRAICKKCSNDQNMRFLHRTGRSRPMDKAKDCSNYLGIVVAERVLKSIFSEMKQMPVNNPGYDFLCSKEKKIDVKSACLRVVKGRNEKEYQTWNFRIGKNKEADYFLCLAFNNRTELEPQKVWMIAGEEINHLDSISIFNTTKGLQKWSTYERQLNRVVEKCNEIRRND